MRLSKALSACQLVQRTYGKQADDIGIITEIFVRVLRHHNPKDVIDVIRKWIIESPEFPTPSDIENMLNPRPKYNYAIYQRIAHKFKKDSANMTDSEWSYLRKYEKHIMRDY